MKTLYSAVLPDKTQADKFANNLLYNRKEAEKCKNFPAFLFMDKTTAITPATPQGMWRLHLEG